MKNERISVTYGIAVVFLTGEVRACFDGLNSLLEVYPVEQVDILNNRIMSEDGGRVLYNLQATTIVTYVPDVTSGYDPDVETAINNGYPLP